MLMLEVCTDSPECQINFRTNSSIGARFDRSPNSVLDQIIRILGKIYDFGSEFEQMSKFRSSDRQPSEFVLVNLTTKQTQLNARCVYGLIYLKKLVQKLNIDKYTPFQQKSASAPFDFAKTFQKPSYLWNNDKSKVLDPYTQQFLINGPSNFS